MKARLRTAGPRCRWCHWLIEPILIDETEVRIDPLPWRHVQNKQQQCQGRANIAEPIPLLAEDPFHDAVAEFVGQYRKLRRAFRELSQSRASAVRRMKDYQELADKLIEVYESPSTGLPDVDAAIKAIRDYRRSQVAAGWR
jgi:hypothetical protein